ncbi:MAG: hypothetical protein ACOC1P_06370 [Minisyncoccales bacterium]
MTDKYMEKMIKHLKEKLDKRQKEMFFNILEQGFADDILHKSIFNLNVLELTGWGIKHELEKKAIVGRACEVILNEGLE